ncbi:MAG: tRNA (adenosine(37)-N6)-threonylcarbamoyltransferase complex ATPase subunit type 1 TsaE [Chloroflexota bacterium]
MQSETVFSFQSCSEAQTIHFGSLLGQLLDAGHIVALIGNLGTGKTRWAQGIGAGLAVPSDTVINSPTFTFVNQYQGRHRCYHIDLYRLESSKEADTLGLEDYFYDDSVCVVEWADRVTSILPSDRLEIHLQHVDDSTRDVTLKAFGKSSETMLANFRESAFA